MSVPAPALRYHGGKFREAPWIISHFPQHLCYTESYGGAAGVLLQKPRSYAEVYNDLDGEIVNFFRVLQNPVTRALLIDQLTYTPYARAEFDLAWHPATNEVERARRLCIRAQMGFGSAGASTQGSTGFRIDTRREYGTVQQNWTQYPIVIRDVAARMHGVLIENRPATLVMQQHDEPTTLHFVDPPYLHSVRGGLRSGGGKRHGYKFEMTDLEHEELLRIILELKGMVIICGYHSELYDDMLTGWVRVEKLARASAGRGTALRTEVMWINPAAVIARKRTLFL